MKIKILFGILVMSLGMSSCSNFGSVVLPPDRLAYNRSLVGSDDQQILLNIVRMRYTDRPYFLAINNVVSQFSFGSNYSVNVANAAPPPALLGTGNAGFTYSEAPTITYTPLQGEDYINRLLTPVDLSVIYTVLRSGWSLHRVTRVLIQHLGPLDNATLASRPVSSRIPNYKNFLDTVAVFRHMQDKRDVLIRTDLVDNVFAIRVTFNNFTHLTARERKILARLGVTERSPNLWFVSSESKAKNQVQIETRTVLGLLYYLSKSVDIPEADRATKEVRATYYPDGKVFDWHHVTNGIFHVRTSRAKPNNAYVAVQYRGSWFYIPSTDFSSKETLDLLGIIMGIYQTKIQTSLPVFTVS